jgi:hypothetical protein
MIKADPGWVAQFTYGGVDEDVPIVAWSSEGGPLVVEWSTGQLVPPRELRDKGSFARVVHKPAPVTVPGGDWKIQRRFAVNGREQWYDFGVVAFELCANGDVHAVTIDGHAGPKRHPLGKSNGVRLMGPHLAATEVV